MIGTRQSQRVAEWPVLSLVAWDVFDAVFAPGDVILLMSWSDHDAVEAFEVKTPLRGGGAAAPRACGAGLRQFDRREAPQYYSEVRRAETTRRCP